MSVMLERDDGPQTVMENVTNLEMTPDGVLVSALFEEPVLVHASVRRIDFLGGTVILIPDKDKGVKDEGNDKD